MKTFNLLAVFVFALFFAPGCGEKEEKKEKGQRELELENENIRLRQKLKKAQRYKELEEKIMPPPRQKVGGNGIKDKKEKEGEKKPVSTSVLDKRQRPAENWKDSAASPKSKPLSKEAQESIDLRRDRYILWLKELKLFRLTLNTFAKKVEIASPWMLQELEKKLSQLEEELGRNFAAYGKNGRVIFLNVLGQRRLGQIQAMKNKFSERNKEEAISKLKLYKEFLNIEIAGLEEEIRILNGP